MATTISWPPTPKNGRLTMVSGAEATRILVMMTLGDLRANPYNETDLSLGDVTYRVRAAIRGRIETALRRLRRAIRVEMIDETRSGDSATFDVRYLDLETKTKGKVTIDG